MDYSIVKGKIAKLINKRDHKLALTANCTDIEMLKRLHKDIENIRQELKTLKNEVLKEFFIEDV